MRDNGVAAHFQTELCEAEKRNAALEDMLLITKLLLAEILEDMSEINSTKAIRQRTETIIKQTKKVLESTK